MPKVSVIMAVYNGEKYLGKAIESTLNQTFKDFEFIIVNDASTDKTEDIVKEFMERDKRMKLINNEKNVERSASRNRGIKMAKGEYIAIMDADDISFSERLEKEVKFLDKNPVVGLVGTWSQIIDEYGNVIGLFQPASRNTEIKEKLMEINPFIHGSVMLRRGCLEKIGLYREGLEPAEDYDLWLRIFEKYKVANIPEFLYKWRLTLNSSSVIKKNIQGKCADLAKELAVERKKFGKDIFQRGKRKEIEKTLKKIRPTPWFEKRKDFAKSYYFWGSRLFYSGDFKRCKKFIKKAFLLNPFINIEIWQILIHLYAPQRLLKILRFLRNSMFG